MLPAILTRRFPSRNAVIDQLGSNIVRNGIGDLVEEPKSFTIRSTRRRQLESATIIVLEELAAGHLVNVTTKRRRKPVMGTTYDMDTRVPQLVVDVTSKAVLHKLEDSGYTPELVNGEHKWVVPL